MLPTLISCHIRKYEYVKICCCHICDTYVGNANLLKVLFFLVLEAAIVSLLATLLAWLKLYFVLYSFSVANVSCQVVQCCIFSAHKLFFFFLVPRSCTKTQTNCLKSIFWAKMIKVFLSIRRFWLNSISRRHKRHKCVNDRRLRLTHKSNTMTAAAILRIVLFHYYSCFVQRTYCEQQLFEISSNLSDSLNFWFPNDSFSTNYLSIE